ncbi:hypothetical protein LDE01_18320 [Lactobacillus delbrueckii subsp. delbrueckii]|jgi:hypothetical protein|nr:hypothetical protein LDE01_18320 [Lactobacillus delbrueckii subsp. delbrueckii]
MKTSAASSMMKWLGYRMKSRYVEKGCSESSLFDCLLNDFLLESEGIMDKKGKVEDDVYP